jgi:hypothetical protein
MRRGGWNKLMAAVLVLAVCTTSAPAFYWAGWPGSNIVVPPVQSEQRLVTPSVPTPPVPPPYDPPDDPGINNTPEPATLVVLGTGLAMLAGTRLWKKRKPTDHVA